MNSKRREVLRVTAVLSLMAATGLISEAQAAEWNKNAFDGKSVADVIKALGGSGTEKSTAITFNAPDIAENGAVVPMAVASGLAGVKHLLVLVEKNPSALVAKFDVSDAVEPNFATRAKMGQTSDVYAVAITGDGKAYYAKKEVKVTLGGCGG